MPILGPIADANVDVDMIIQNASVDGITDFSFTVHRNDFQKSMEISRKIQAHIGARDIVGDNRVCKVSMVGVGMRSHVGIASQMFRTLAEEGINIQMISTSEIKISVVVDEKYMELAVRVLHSVRPGDAARLKRRDPDAGRAVAGAKKNALSGAFFGGGLAASWPVE